MGGCCCCCSSNRVEGNDSSRILYHYPVVSEEGQLLSSSSGAASGGLLVDTNLDTSIPDTYSHPPAPLPYDANNGNLQGPPQNNLEVSINKHDAPVQTNNSEPTGEMKVSNSEENVEVVATEEVDGEVKKSNTPFLAPEECPTCLEEYDEENPKIMTKCEHHFHLSCILEWKERSDTCPVCDQEIEVM